VERLFQNFNNGFSLSWVSATHQVDNDCIRGQNGFCKGFGLSNHFKLDDGVTGYWYCLSIFLNHCAEELVGFTSSLNHNVIVTHKLEQAMADQTVAARYQNAFTLVLWNFDFI